MKIRQADAAKSTADAADADDKTDATVKKVDNVDEAEKDAIQRPSGDTRNGAGGLGTDASNVSETYSGSHVDSPGSVLTETSHTAQTSLDFSLTTVAAESPEILFADRMHSDDSSENESVSQSSHKSTRKKGSIVA